MGDWIKKGGSSFTGSAPAPVPGLPSDVAITILDKGRQFGIRLDWTLPDPLAGTVAYERQVRYYKDAALTVADSDWIGLGPVNGATTATAEAGPFQRPSYDAWVVGRVRSYNADGILTAWATTTAAAKVDKSTEATLAIPSQPTDFSLAITDYAMEPITGRPMVQVTISLTEHPADADYFSVWSYKGVSAPSDPSLYEHQANQTFQTTGTSSVDVWLYRESAATTLWVAVTGSSFTQYTFPDGSTVHKSIVIPAIAPAAQVTGFSVDVLQEANATVPAARFRFNFTAPSDPEYWTQNTYRIATDASFTPLGGAQWELVDSHSGPTTQTFPWNLPSAAEYWKFKSQSVTKGGLENTSSAPTYNVTVPASTAVAMAPPAGNVTSPTVECKYVRREGKWVRQLHCAAVRPATLGSFAGIHLHREEPDQSATAQLVADGVAAWDGTKSLGETAPTAIPGPKEKYETDGKVIIWDNLDPVTEATNVRVYFPSFNTADQENALVRHGRPGETPSAVVTCYPPPSTSGPSGEEFAPKVPAFDASYRYDRDPATGGIALIIETTETAPASADYLGCQIGLLRGDGVEYPLTGPNETLGYTFSPITQLPKSVERMYVRCYSTGPGGTNSYVHLITPEKVLDVQPYFVDVPMPSGSGFTVTATYSDFAANGKRNLRLVPNFTAPDGSTGFNFYEYWAKREDGKWYELGSAAHGGESDAAVIEQLPAVTYLWQFLLVPYDVHGKNRDGGNSTDPDNPPSGTLTYSLSIAPPPIGPAGQEYASNVTGLSVGIETVDRSAGGVDWTEFRFAASWTNPVDTRRGKIKVLLQRTSGTPQFVGDPVYEGPNATTTRTGWQTVTPGETYTLYVVSVDVYGNENTITASTPQQAGLSPTTFISNTLKLNRADTSTFNSSEFQINPVTNKWETLQLDAQKVFVGSILRVGGGTIPGSTAPSFKGANGQIAVYNSGNTLRAWMGQNGAVYGGWFGELYVGGTGVSDSPLYANNAGFVIIGGFNGSNPYISLRDNGNSEVGRIGANLNGTLLQGAWFQAIKIAPSLLAASPRLQMSGSVLQIEGASISVTGGSHTTNIDPTSGFQIVYGGGVRTVKVSGTNFGVYSGFSGCGLDENGILMQDGINATQITKSAMQLGGSLIFTMNYSSSSALYATTASTGFSGALPAQVEGYIRFSANGNTYKIPFYRN